LEQRVRARVDVAEAFGAVNSFDAAYAKLEEALALAGERDDLRRPALFGEIEVAVRSGDFARAIRAADSVAAMGPVDEPRVLLAVALARAAVGDEKAALCAIDDAERHAEPSDLVATSEREKQRVLVCIYLRDFRGAVEASARAVDAARSANLRFEMSASLHNLGDASRRVGDLLRAYASLTESKEVAEAAGHERLVAINRAHLAYLDGLKGSAEAEQLLRECIRYSDSRGYLTDTLESRYLLGAFLKHKGARAEAKRELEEVLRMAEAYGNSLVAIDARELLESC
jgi:tetratricopeptide (TPR) repeat protein